MKNRSSTLLSPNPETDPRSIKRNGSTTTMFDDEFCKTHKHNFSPSFQILINIEGWFVDGRRELPWINILICQSCEILTIIYYYSSDITQKNVLYWRSHSSRRTWFTPGQYNTDETENSCKKNDRSRITIKFKMVSQKQMLLCFGLISVFHYLSMYWGWAESEINWTRTSCWSSKCE